MKKKSHTRKFTVGDFVCAQSPTITSVDTDTPLNIGNITAHKIAKILPRKQPRQIILVDHPGEVFYADDFRVAYPGEIHEWVRRRSTRQFPSER
jgi:hypothetical protein